MESAKIHKAIIGVMSEIGAIGKEKKNQQQGFLYRGIDDVMNALQPMLIKHGVFVMPEVLEQSREDRTSSKGNALIYSVCKIKYTFFADDGSSLSAITIGEGMDSGDKATNKAMAIAFKYACFQVFCIPTEEMPDPDAESHDLASRNAAAIKQKVEQPPKQSGNTNCISEKQAKRLFAISGGSPDIVKKVMSDFGYPQNAKSTNIKYKDYEAICAEVENAKNESHYTDDGDLPWNDN